MTERAVACRKMTLCFFKSCFERARDGRTSTCKGEECPLTLKGKWLKLRHVSNGVEQWIGTEHFSPGCTVQKYEGEANAHFRGLRRNVCTQGSFPQSSSPSTIGFPESSLDLRCVFVTADPHVVVHVHFTGTGVYSVSELPAEQAWRRESLLGLWSMESKVLFLLTSIGWRVGPMSSSSSCRASCFLWTSPH